MQLTESTTEHIERALDDALTMTFPASDPVAVSAPMETAPSATVVAAPRSISNATGEE